MSNLTEYAKNISPSLYLQLKQAVETGKWLDGKPLKQQQKDETLQLILMYQSLYNDKPDHFTVAKGGELHMKKKSVLKNQFSTTDVHKIDLKN